ncbi:pyridoxal-phosphate dependent enzyme [Streptomyces sp. NPDC005500]|uniref:pyridoxal-phosphate dependent enzyme n=1 Tax=Streptomyces sp. NPDC005500 TaxID=3155007 RepID=UPI0033B8AEC7
MMGVDPASADDTRQSICSGRKVTISAPVTIADSLGYRTPPDLTFQINRFGLRGVIAAPEPGIADAMAYLWRRYGIKAEPSGAVAFAGLVQSKRFLSSGSIGVVVSDDSYNLDTSIARSRCPLPLPVVDIGGAEVTADGRDCVRHSRNAWPASPPPQGSPRTDAGSVHVSGGRPRFGARRYPSTKGAHGKQHHEQRSEASDVSCTASTDCMGGWCFHAPEVECEGSQTR